MKFGEEQPKMEGTEKIQEKFVNNEFIQEEAESVTFMGVR